jgi:hypothetical protein
LVRLLKVINKAAVLLTTFDCRQPCPWSTRSLSGSQKGTER